MPYNGPKWVGPLFKWLAIAGVVSYILGHNHKVEWECNDES